MSKVTGKFQITLPKRLVEVHAIRVGDDLEIISDGNRICLLPPRRMRAEAASPSARMDYFDRATERQEKRERSRGVTPGKARGWTRAELYSRGRPG
jgi:bifunctional DNA-binding transcriptional regulator/antitoxin component of YhaV-PrlF toxin-antitoxin module